MTSDSNANGLGILIKKCVLGLAKNPFYSKNYLQVMEGRKKDKKYFVGFFLA